MQEKKRGKVKWFDSAKGYGFITPDDGGKDLFCHYTGIVGRGFKALTDGQAVEYMVEQSDKGPKAVSVQSI